MRLVHGDRVAEAALPFAALGLSRRMLDAALLARAEALGARVLRGRTVREVGPGLNLLVDDEAFAPGTLFLATGKHDLRGARRTLGQTPDDLVGFKMHFALRPRAHRALAGHVEVLLFRGGYAGMQLIEADRATYACWSTGTASPPPAEIGRRCSRACGPKARISPASSTVRRNCSRAR